MKIRLLDVAQQELDETIEYFYEEVPDLGKEFLAEVLKALDRIGRHPHAWHPCSERTRRWLLRRFPYAVIYQILEKEILVVAVACLQREPNYWQARISSKTHYPDR
ncbi:MAG TPA: type II toxin-antitoxin system RelE/ParE family toxin [Gammaproteobacteria bacterium]|nr:type II toxin-antitoxin system RelE/ParE family toxin [Gammaproteobacteria bacterium]